MQFSNFSCAVTHVFQYFNIPGFCQHVQENQDYQEESADNITPDHVTNPVFTKVDTGRTDKGDQRNAGYK